MTDTEEGRGSVKRFDQEGSLCVMYESRDGVYVLASDYDTLARQLAEAREEVEALQQRCDMAGQIIEALGIETRAAGVEIKDYKLVNVRAEAAERRLAEVEQKAKRYDWIRDEDELMVVMVFANNVGHHLDEAIDAAIAAGGGLPVL